ncbi:MAG: Sir2 family NAD-dependent protein deacetylase [Planctomycetota bacterium]|nr:Sir2 family NAD-dependent protein deacetylase [Planctomycetota bacterium]
MNFKESCKQAAKAIADADSLLIATGAGMSVDSGLPDFRGDQGFWKAYPPFRDAGLSFTDVANPKWFFTKPEQAWGFYGHRYQLYRATRPHRGYQILLRWSQWLSGDSFVFTSNVDGHFQQSGFDPERIVECHGSIHHWQCSAACTNQIGLMSDFEIQIDENSFLASPPFPQCPNCGDLARPNILMFGDYQWVEDRTQEQIQRYNQWRQDTVGKKHISLEIGAGKAIPTIRWECESQSALLIRINPRDTDVPPGGISIAANALAAIEQINRELQGTKLHFTSTH